MKNSTTGLVPRATLIDRVEEATVLPLLSCTVTVGGPVIVPLGAAFPGCVVKASRAGAPGETVNGAGVSRNERVATGARSGKHYAGLGSGISR